MSKAIHDLLNDEKTSTSHGLAGVQGNFPLDEAVLDAMPEGTRILSAEAYGYSAWTITARVATVLPDGTLKKYFLKCASEDHGKTMMFGEFTSISEIHSLVPGLVPAPHGWGKYKQGSPGTYFFLEDFIDMDTSAPEPGEFTAKVAELHRRSTSPTGKFGYQVTTCDGKLPHTVEWEESWAKFFSKLLRGVLKLDAEVNGVWDELEAAAEQLVTAVIPRLLGILQAGGRVLKPSLIHGDCWEGQSFLSLGFESIQLSFPIVERFPYSIFVLPYTGPFS